MSDGLTREENRVLRSVEMNGGTTTCAIIMTRHHMTMREAFKCLASIEAKGKLKRTTSHARGVFTWTTGEG